MPTTFHELDIKAGLKNKRILTAFLNKLVLTYRIDTKKVQLTYIFCTDSYLLQLNQQYLHHDTFTDIITFDLCEPPKYLIAGEMYISIDRIKENAKEFNTQYTDELHRVLFHGVLHLCGFKDKTKEDQVIMRSQEDACLLNYKKETEEIKHANRNTL